MNNLNSECPIVKALGEIGDTWTLLIIRESLYGVTSFEEYQQSLSIARNILSDRLRRLVQAGILEKRPGKDDARSRVYELTTKGKSLWPLIIWLVNWSNRWLAEPGKHPIEARDLETGAIITGIGVVDEFGRLVDPNNTILKAGPGASKKFAARIDSMFG